MLVCAQGGGNKVNVVNQLLTELDGFDTRKQVYVIGATNRLGIITTVLLSLALAWRAKS